LYVWLSAGRRIAKIQERELYPPERFLYQHGTRLAGRFAHPPRFPP
jgi:hypothetical protein